jgi:hypothetical protein
VNISIRTCRAGRRLSNVEALYDRGRDAVARYVFNDELRTPIVRNHLGDSAGVIGGRLADGDERVTSVTRR